MASSLLLVLSPLLVVGCDDSSAGTEVDTKAPGWTAADEALVLRAANEASFDALDLDAHLDRRAASNIVTARAGFDGIEPSADDVPFESIEELDAVKYVGPTALESLHAYAIERYGLDLDADGDGFSVGLDCDDADGAIHPDALEICDGVDNDCDALTTEDGLVSADGLPAASLAQAALSAAEVLVCPGTYAGGFEVNGAVRGVGPAEEIVVTSPCSTCDAIVVANDDVVLEGFTITGEGGGVVMNNHSRLLVQGMRFVGLENDRAVSVSNNSWGVTVEIRDSTFEGNLWGAIQFQAYGSRDHSNLRIYDSVFVGNDSPYSGGALYQDGGRVFVYDSVMEDNSAAKGGAIFLKGWTSGNAPYVEVHRTDMGEGGSDNEPSDVEVDGYVHDFGVDASFYCSASSSRCVAP